MEDWNVIVTTREAGYRKAQRILGDLGQVSRTGYYNVLAVTVDDLPAFLDALAARLEREEEEAAIPVAHVVPVTQAFTFQSPEAFRERARAAVLDLAPRLEGRSFHVRLHRRGFKGRLRSPEEERALSEALLSELEARGAPGRISFDDPDAAVVIETVDGWAGVALVTREARTRYAFVSGD